MRRYVFGICWLFLGVCLGLAQASGQLTEMDREGFHADFPSGGQLRMHIRSGDLRIVGSNENKIEIRYWGKNASRAHDVKISLRTAGSTGELRVAGGPRNAFQIEIRVPKISDLYLRMPAGEAQVDGIVGNKNVKIHAGDLMLQIGRRKSTPRRTLPFWPVISMPARLGSRKTDCFVLSATRARASTLSMRMWGPET